MDDLKIINPAAHAVLDYAAAATFIGMGFGLRRRNPQAARCAFMNGAAVLGLSLLTDYPGGVLKAISFQTHGVLDTIQAGLTALGPALMGFDRTPEARLFYAQAGAEGAIVAATDWQPATAR